MKKTKKLLLLLGVLAVAVVVLLVVTRLEEKKEQIQTADTAILSIPTEDITNVSWDLDDGTTLSFHKEDGWVYDDDAAFPVDDAAIEKLLSVFKDFGAAFVIETPEDEATYGLTTPVCTIRLTTADQEYEVVCGTYSTMDSQRYVSIGDGNVYLVSTDPYASYDTEISRLILNDETPAAKTADKITFSGLENYELTYAEDSTATYCDSDVYFTETANGTLPLDTTQVLAYLDTIGSLSLSDYVSYNVTEDELSAWGLDTPELTVTVNYTEEDADGNETAKEFVLNIGRNQAELAEKEAADAACETYEGTITNYVRVGDSQIVYTITESTYDALAACAVNDLRHTDVLTMASDDITAIDATVEGETCTFTKDEVIDDDGNVETVYRYNGEEVPVNDVLTAMSALTISKFTEDVKPEQEELSMVFALDNENYPEITLEAYRYDGTYCIIVLNGKVLGLAQRSQVNALIEAINYYRLG